MKTYTSDVSRKSKEFGDRAGVEAGDAHAIALACQSAPVAAVESHLTMAAQQNSAQAALPYIDAAISQIKAIVVAGASVGHEADKVMTMLGQTPPAWLKELEAVLDRIAAEAGTRDQMKAAD